MAGFLRSFLRTGLPLAALGLHFIIVLFFIRRWDKVTAVTVIPFWAWGIGGLTLAALSFALFRTRFALAVSLLWAGTTVIGADETRPLLRVTQERPEQGSPADFQGKKTIRVITLNCKRNNPVSAQEVLPWNPDIVLFQESPYPEQLHALAKKLYPMGNPREHVAGGWECAVIARGKVISLGDRKVANFSPNLFNIMPCVVQFDGGQLFKVVCVHLQGAVTNLSLYKPGTWELHYRNRQSRRWEMAEARLWLDMLPMTPPSRTPSPIVIGGDFNAPAGDAVFRELEPDFTDAFREAGSGWGDTYPNETPVVRIDHIYANQLLKPVRARTVKTANSDHQMVVVDFVLAQ